MPRSFAAITSRSRAAVRKNGAPVRFEPPVGSALPAVIGYAMQIEDDPDAYEALGLVGSHTMTLLFVRDTYDVLPSLLDRTVEWAGCPYVVKNEQPFAPNGNGIFSTVMVIR